MVKVEELRKRLNMSYSEFAFEVGATEPTVRAWEKKGFGIDEQKIGRAYRMNLKRLADKARRTHEAKD